MVITVIKNTLIFIIKKISKRNQTPKTKDQVVKATINEMEKNISKVVSLGDKIDVLKQVQKCIQNKNDQLKKEWNDQWEKKQKETWVKKKEQKKANKKPNKWNNQSLEFDNLMNNLGDGNPDDYSKQGDNNE